MEIIHDLTKDGQLKIVQDTEMNTYTFDSILLSYFTTVNKRTKKVVDLCSGNGPIGMLLSRRLYGDDYQIKCVEIQEHIADLGAKSIKLNNLDNNMEMICDDLIDISETIGKNNYNLVTCNPPYFKVDPDSNLNPNSSVAIARHELCVNLEEIIDEARKLLDNMGLFSIVFRPERFDELIVLLDAYGFKVKRMQFVYPKQGQKCNTILVEARKGQVNSQVQILEPLYVYNQDDTYTEDALKIVNQ